MNSIDPRLLDLLESWEQARQHNPDLSLEAFCAGCPDLLEPARQQLELRQRLQRLGGLDTGAAGEATLTLNSWLDRDPGVPTIPNYEILERLGHGGMGTVYRGRDRRAKRDVALKVIRGLADGQTLARFQAEAEAVARLNHPHIVQLYEVGTWQPADGVKLPYLALEFVPGGSLARRLDDRPVDPREAARLVAIVARAVQAAHEAGIVHRDLKPDNLLLGPPVEGSNGNTAFGWPKVGDFGLARRRQPDGDGRLTGAGMMMGTPAYMAPEQAEGKQDVGPPADVWSLGVILYRLVTGKPAFAADTVVELLYRICHETPTPLRQVCAEVPAGLEAICLDCLSRDPASRPTADDLARRLTSFAQGETADWEAAKASGGRKPLVGGAPIPSRRRLLGLALAGGLVPAVGLGWWFWGRGPGVEKSDTALPPFKGFIDAEMTRPGDAMRQLLPLRDPAARPLQAGDEVRVKVELNRTGYAYVLWIDSAGESIPVYPWLENRWERRGEERPVATLKLPWQDGKWKWMEIDNGPAGLETMVLLVRETPLSEEEGQGLKQALAGLGKQPLLDDVGLAVAWFENGELVRDEPERGPKLGAVKEGSSPLERVNREVQARVGKLFAYTRAVTFANRGGKRAGGQP